MKADSILATIGNTPHVRLSRLFPDHEVWVKSERTNPGGSIKDRIALAMIEAAEADGSLKAGGTIVEPTSGNTGIGLAMVAAVKGYKLVLVMPESMSIERRRLMLAYGATFDLTPREKGMKGAIERAREIVAETPGAWMPQQFDNPANVAVHVRTTAQEILADFADSPIDVLITGVGTGGHLTGCAEELKKHWPAFKAYAVEPTLSPVISGGSRHRTRSRASAPGSFRATCTPRQSTARSRSIRPMPRNGPAVRRARKACWWAFPRARRWPPSPPSCANCPPAAACSASTMTPANAICRCPISFRSNQP
jgi:cysteine synthase